MGKVRVEKRGMANSVKCSQEVKRARDWSWKVDLAIWKLLSFKEAVRYRGERR